MGTTMMASSQNGAPQYGQTMGTSAGFAQATAAPQPQKYPAGFGGAGTAGTMGVPGMPQAPSFAPDPFAGMSGISAPAPAQPQQASGYADSNPFANM